VLYPLADAHEVRAGGFGGYVIDVAVADVHCTVRGGFGAFEA
jgi:hypothetical protein